MPTILTEASLAEYQIARYMFSQANVAASQTAAALTVLGTGATNGTNDVTGIPAEWNGRICYLALINTIDKGAGTLTIVPTIAGTAITAPTALVNLAIAAAATPATAKVEYGSGAPFTVGQLLGVKITTNGAWDATTADLVVVMGVVYYPVQL